MGRSDTDIWNDVLSGKADAWKSLVLRYQALVYTVASRAGLEIADVEDCFQQVWYLLYKNRTKITEPSRISAWLVTTAKREAIRLSKRSTKADADIDEISVSDNSPLQDAELEQLELQAQLEIGLKALDKRCREMLHAMFFAPEEKTYEEIARELGIAINSIGPIRRRCLEKLKKVMIESGYLGVRIKEQ